MKRYIAGVLVMLAAAISLHAQSAAPDAAELTRLLNEFLAGAGRNDAALHDRFWADDLIYTRSSGVRTNKPDLMKGVRSAPPRKDTDPVSVYTAEDIQIHQYGNAAVVAFRLVSTTTKSDGTKTIGNNLNTGTFIKRKGVWQAVAWQSTIVPKTDSAKALNKAETSKPAGVASGPDADTSQNKSTASSESRTYSKGSKGGCYYLSTGGKKIYVNHDLCK